METNNINDTNEVKGKGTGFLAYLGMFVGFIVFMVLLSKLLKWMMG